MNSRTGNLLNVLTAGFIVLVIFALVTFFGRSWFFETLITAMSLDSKQVIISPSGLVEGEGPPRQTTKLLAYADVGLSSDPNMRVSAVQFEFYNYFTLMEETGISRQFSYIPGRRYDTKERIYYHYYGDNDYIFFDKHTGQFVYSYPIYPAGPNSFSEVRPKAKLGEPEKGPVKSKIYFAGPNGVSETVSDSLGRFTEPIVDEMFFRSNLVLYEAAQRRFYFIDFYNQKVTVSPQLAREDKREPVAIAESVHYFLGIGWTPPAVRDANDQWKGINTFLLNSAEPNEKWIGPWSGYSSKYLTVIDKSGQIYEVNTDGWSFRDVGYLPAPQSLFSDDKKEAIAAPRNLLQYQVNPLYYTLIRSKGNRYPETEEIKYLGMCVSALSREGTAMVVAVFDPNGKLICRGDTRTNKVTYDRYGRSEGLQSTASAVFSRSSLATALLYITENLQPVVFEAGSYLCGNCIEASAGHRALFILPDSFVGMLGRYKGDKFDQPVFLPILMGPSLVLSIWLAYLVRKNAKTIGLSNTASKWWTIGTFAFGLPAYITYCLTKPKERLVTCQNCGNMRRPDMESCHRCGSKWVIPEMMAPSWRIRD